MRTFIILFLLGFFVSCASNEKLEALPEEYTFPVESPGSMK